MNKPVPISLLSVLLFLMLCSVLVAETEKELFDRGVVLLKNDRFQEAVDQFTRLVRQAPGNPDAYKNRGVAYMKMGKYDLAIQDFEKTREILPDMKGLHSNLGVAWYYKGEYEKAIQNYNQEISLTPDNYYAFFNRAICRMELNDLGQSLEDVNRAIALSADFYLAHCLRGDVLAKMEKTALAREAYARAVQIDPDQAYARDQMASLPREADTGSVQNKTGSRIVEKPIQDQGTSGPEAVKGFVRPEKSLALDPPPPPQAAVAKKHAAYELQAGAFQSKKNALNMKKKLAANGHEARVTEVDRPNGKHWYLVRTGGFETMDSARAAQSEMSQALGMDFLVRPSGEF